MREVGIRELTRDASAIVGAVAAGETVVITRRGTRAARLGPSRPSVGAQRLVADGRRSPPSPR